MRNKANETAILTALSTIDGVAAGMQNRTLAEELNRRTADYRVFVLNPGPAFENQPSPATTNPPPAMIGSQPYPKWLFPNPDLDDAQYSPALATQFTGGAFFAASKPYKKMERNFNWLMDNYGVNVAYSYLVNSAPIATLSNQFRALYDDNGGASAAICNYYLQGAGASVRSTTSENGASFTYGSVVFALPYPTGTIASPTAAI